MVDRRQVFERRMDSGLALWAFTENPVMQTEDHASWPTGSCNWPFGFLILLRNGLADRRLVGHPALTLLGRGPGLKCKALFDLTVECGIWPCIRRWQYSLMFRNNNIYGAVIPVRTNTGSNYAAIDGGAPALFPRFINTGTLQSPYRVCRISNGQASRH